jgi:hypothetical protein
MPKWCDIDKAIGNNKRHISAKYALDCHPVVDCCYVKKIDKLLKLTEGNKIVGVSVYDQDGRIGVFDFDFVKRSKTVKGYYSAVYKKWQGCGIGFEVYMYILKKYGKLMSGKTLTGRDGFGSFNLYEKLSKQVGVKSYIVDTRTGVKKRVKYFKKSHMDYKYNRFLITMKV